MNKRQKIVQQAFLDDEEKVIHKLKNQYHHALKELENKAKNLQKDIERLDTLAKLSIDDEEKEKILSMRRSKVYQKQYQDSLKKQVSNILDNMHENEFKTVSAYLEKCYEQGFLGAMYDLQGQGIPLCFPLDQEAMVRAVQIDSKISQGLYSRLGEDVSLLKKKITAQVSRGISTGMTFGQVAQQLAGVTNIGFNNAVRIARTEGHRIQCQSGMDACYKAREKGANVVKQWDATLDAKTRESHVHVHGEIRELDEKFSNGLMFPSDPSGSAAEVINCRCALLQRAKWALDEDELTYLKESAEFFGIDKTNSFEDFKNKYLKATEMHQFDEPASPPEEFDGVFNDFAELNLSKEESEALSTLWEAAYESGCEYGVVIDNNGIIGELVTSNLPDAVKIPLDSYGNGLTVLHSHTNATPPSITDFQRLLDEKIDKIGVIGYNNDVYMAYIGNGEVPNIDDFINTTKSIAREVDIDMLDNPSFFDWSIEERNYMAIREQAYRVAQHYGWTLEGGRIDGK